MAVPPMVTAAAPPLYAMVALEGAGGSASWGGDSGGESGAPWPWGVLGLDPYLTLGMALVSFTSESLYGATSFGPAITFNVGWQICYMLGLNDGTLTTVSRRRCRCGVSWCWRRLSAALSGCQVAVHMTVMEICSASLQCWLLFKQVDFWLLLATSIPCCTCIAIGQLFMIELDGVWYAEDCLRLPPHMSCADVDSGAGSSERSA